MNKERDTSGTSLLGAGTDRLGTKEDKMQGNDVSFMSMWNPSALQLNDCSVLCEPEPPAVSGGPERRGFPKLFSLRPKRAWQKQIGNSRSTTRRDCEHVVSL